ncbi:hypothetical protein scyTo_0001890 [Scyliorhinus torazame]|uniref:Uncharacterized protein n=1 Tax=Scyliorhinus torazame TaxID=75743 RepID=A0A401PGJ0_SCYTO|nr:hypothetical protein [Scyliorhinus torazame]
MTAETDQMKPCHVHFLPALLSPSSPVITGGASPLSGVAIQDKNDAYKEAMVLKQSLKQFGRDDLTLSSFRSSKEAVSSVEVIVQHGLDTPEGLAVDWIAGNIYWIDSKMEQIEVAKLDGNMRTTLIAGSMMYPRAIALDPRHGILFWTDWDSSFPRIEAASMSGAGRKAIYKALGTSGWLNGLTVDYLENRIVWIDAMSDGIYSALYDGSELIEVLHNHEYLSHPFAVTLYGGDVYWTDWKTNTLLKANKWTGHNVTVVQRTSARPYDLQIYHQTRQPQGTLAISLLLLSTLQNDRTACEIK